jgi:transketolase
MAEAHMSAIYNRPNFELFNSHTFVFCGDGCLMEGITAEAASLAGHLKLGKLIVCYDDNSITIDGETELAFTEDVGKRFESYGWEVIVVSDGDTNFDAINNALEAAKQSDKYDIFIWVPSSPYIIIIMVYQRAYHLHHTHHTSRTSFHH